MSEIKHQYFCTKCGAERDGLLDHPARGIGGYSWNCPRCNGPVDSREVVMSEAPKKIWMVEETCWLNHDQPSGDIPYIRADIVDELVEALERLARLGNGDSYGNSIGNEIARAALAKLEESHE